MIASLKPYPEYKKSGLPWIDQVPVHWDNYRLDKLFDVRKERSSSEDERVTAYLNGRVTLRSNVKGQKIKGVIKDSNWIRIHPGDFAISGMNAHLGGMGVSDSFGKCSPIYIILKPKSGVNAQYVSHMMRHLALVGVLKSFVSTIRYNSADFKQDALKLFRIPMPDVDEQAKIVSFIDWTNSRLDKTIRAKKKVIALLNEQKQAIIQHAINCGLDPTTQIKPSGILWLGDIPEHWELRKIRSQSSRITKGTTPTTLGREFTTSGIRFIKVESISKARTIIPEMCVFIDKATDTLLSRSRIEVGDVVVAIAGAIGRTAVIASADVPANANQAVGIITPLIRKMRSEWLAYVLSSPGCQCSMAESSVQSAQSNLSLSNLGSMIIPLPPAVEQDKIINYLTSAMHSLDAFLTRQECEINLLNEYRTQLIGDIVTGKLDVREAAAHLFNATLSTTELDGEIASDESRSDHELDDEEAEA